jgi:hypothetical protein
MTDMSRNAPLGVVAGWIRDYVFLRAPGVTLLRALGVALSFFLSPWFRV